MDIKYSNDIKISLFPTQHSVTLKFYSIKRLKQSYRTRLYVLLILIIALLLASEGLQHHSIDIFSGIRQYYALSVITIIFLYCCLPFTNKAICELKERKTGLTSLVLVVIVMAYLYSLQTFFRMRTLNSLTEFASLLLVAVAGGCILEITNEENSTIQNQQKKQIDTILASIDEIIWSLNTDTLELQYANYACHRIFGYTPEEMIRDKNILLDSVHPGDRAMFYAAIHDVIKSGYATCEFRIFHKNGALKYLRGEAKLQRNTNGENNVINGITIDITRQRLAELEATQKGNEVEQILNSINDAFFAINRDYTVIYVNSEFRDLYKNNFKVLIGTAYKDIAPKEIQKSFYKYCEKAMRDHMNTSFEEYCVLLNRWFYYKIYPTESGAAIYITDITEQKRLLDQVTTEKRKLEVQYQKLSEIAWMQSHKVRSPLANIMGLIPLLDFGDPTNPENMEILEGVKIASGQLDEVVREMSDKINSSDAHLIYMQQYKSGAANNNLDI